MAKPLLDLFCITEEGCEYPVAIKVTMDDGSIQTYNLANKHDIMFTKVMKSVQKSVEIGYQYKYPRRRKNRVHRGKL